MNFARLISSFRIEKAHGFPLADFDPADTCGLDIGKSAARDMIADAAIKCLAPNAAFRLEGARRPAEFNASFTSFRDSHGPQRGFWHVDAPRNSRDRRGDCGPPRAYPCSSGAAPYSPLRAGWALHAWALRGFSRPEPQGRLAGARFAAISVKKEQFP